MTESHFVLDWSCEVLSTLDCLQKELKVLMPPKRHSAPSKIRPPRKVNKSILFMLKHERALMISNYGVARRGYSSGSYLFHIIPISKMDHQRCVSLGNFNRLPDTFDVLKKAMKTLPQQQTLPITFSKWPENLAL